MAQINDTDIWTWRMVEAGVRELARRLRDRSYPPLRALYGLSRGGLVPGVMLSHVLRVDFFPVVQADLLRQNSSPDICVVDDIVDTGKMYRDARWAFPNARYVTLASKHPKGIDHTTYTSVFNVAPTTWVVFPWEGEYE